MAQDNGQGVNLTIGYRLCTPIVLLTHNAIECLVPENSGGAGHGIRVVVSGLMSSGTVENAPTSARMSFSKPVITKIVGWPVTGMPTSGDVNLTILGLNFGSSDTVARSITIGKSTYFASDVQLVGNHTQLNFVCPPGEDINLPITVTVTGQSSIPTETLYSYAPPNLSNLIARHGYPTSGCHTFNEADTDAQARVCGDSATFEIHGHNFGLSSPTVVVQDILGKEKECAVLEHSHFRIKAELSPGIGTNAIVTVSSGSLGLQRKSNSLSFSYDKPKVSSVWSGPTLKSLKVSSVFDASAPDGETLFVFGENFGETCFFFGCCCCCCCCY